MLRSAASDFTSSLLASDPPVDGLDDSIIIPSRRLHLTLGVMSLEDNQEQADSSSPSTVIYPPSLETPNTLITNTPSTLASALALLNSLRPTLLQMLERRPLLVPLESIDIMKPGRSAERRSKDDPMNAHILFAGPLPSNESEDLKRLREICSKWHRLSFLSCFSLSNT